MKSNDQPRFAAVMEILCATFQREPSTFLFDAYRTALADLPIEAVENAAGAALGSLKFMPKPVELRELAGAKNAPSIEDRALIAWGCVLQAIRDTSGYATVDFDDPVINATIRDLGGWIQLSDKSSEELHKWTIKDFTRAYCAYARAPGLLSYEALAPLVGLTEAHCEIQFRSKLKPDTWQTIATSLPRLPGLPAPTRRKQISGDPNQAATIAASLNGVGQ